MAVTLRRVLLVGHVLVGIALIALAVQNFLAGRPLGTVLQGVLGVLVVAVGVGFARLLG